MVRRALVGGVVVVVCGVWVSAVSPSGDGPAANDACRVGVFRTQDVIVAYYRSSAFGEKLHELQAEADAAKAAGDEERHQQLLEQCGASQEHAHQQLAGVARITNILDHLRPALPEVARQAGVQIIVEEPLYVDPAVETVDVTPLLVEKLPLVKPRTEE